MDFGWLLQGSGDLLVGSVRWIGRQSMATLMTGAVVVALLAAGLYWGPLRRRDRQRTPRRRIQTLALKEELRIRLAEPASLFSDPANGAPTMGAGEAFEADIEAAAKTVLIEAGGQRAKAKELLRRRVYDNGTANGRLNGSEAAYWRQLGALSLLDSAGDALAAYARAADLAPDDAESQMLAGVLHLRAGNLAAAEAAFRRQIRLGEGVEGGTARYRGQTMLGDVHAANLAHEEAMAAYQEAQREVLALLEPTPEHSGLQRDLSVTCDRIGDTHLAKGELDAALESYRNGLEIAEVLAKRDPENLHWQRDLSVSHDRVGDVLEKKGDWDGALASFRRGLGIAETLAKRKPGNLGWQWDLSVSHDRIGDVLLAQGRLEEALVSYRRGLAIAEALGRRDPAHTGLQRDLAVSYHKIGSLEAGRGNAGEARELLEKGRAIIARLARIAAHQAQWRSDLSKFDEVLRSLDG
jgi:tetratricopeptide (TPR) repeat protein